VTLVSVVVPTRDRTTWLSTTLRTVLWQRGVELEVIVVDDASSDETGATVRAFADDRITLLRHLAPLGVSRSRNDGVEHATGEWLAFVDDDDVWAPEKLRRQVSASESAGSRWVYVGCVNVDEQLRIIGGAPPPAVDAVSALVTRYNVVPGGGSNVIVRRDLFERVGPFDPRLTNGEDWEMWIRLANVEPPACVAEPLLGYRVHGANASLDIRAILAGVALIERKHGTQVDRGVLHRWIAESCLRTGRRVAALGHFARAALDGQAGEVGGDLMRIVERRVGLASHRRRTSDGVSDWMASARAWLAEIPVT
jgi:glycosyltransferase involved in cell wall biosynthesis